MFSYDNSPFLMWAFHYIHLQTSLGALKSTSVNFGEFSGNHAH